MLGFIGATKECGDGFINWIHQLDKQVGSRRSACKPHPSSSVRDLVGPVKVPELTPTRPAFLLGPFRLEVALVGSL